MSHSHWLNLAHYYGCELDAAEAAGAARTKPGALSIDQQSAVVRGGSLADYCKVRSSYSVDSAHLRRLRAID